MTHPQFVNARLLGEICAWPVAFRRRVVGHLGLTGPDGNVSDHKDELKFWQNLLTYLEGGPVAYQKLSVPIFQTSQNAAWKSIHNKCLMNLLKTDPEVEFAYDYMGDDRTRTFGYELLEAACRLEVIEEAGYILWSYWLVSGSPAINRLIACFTELGACFGIWRAPEQHLLSAPVTVRERQERPAENSPPPAPASSSGTSPAPPPSGTEIPQTLLARLQAQVEEAAEAAYPGPSLRAARATIDALLEEIASRNTALMEAANAELAEAIAGLRRRQPPMDPIAASRRNIALDKVVELSPMEADDALANVRDIRSGIETADGARQTFLSSAAQHDAAPFDRDKLIAYNDAIEHYIEAETALTVCVEKIGGICCK